MSGRAASAPLPVPVKILLIFLVLAGLGGGLSHVNISSGAGNGGTAAHAPAAASSNPCHGPGNKYKILFQVQREGRTIDVYCGDHQRGARHARKARPGRPKPSWEDLLACARRILEHGLTISEREIQLRWGDGKSAIMYLLGDRAASWFPMRGTSWAECADSG